MNTHYTTDRSTQMVLSVLKAYGIKKIVVSPGTTNMAFVASAQSDPCFEMYSSVDGAVGSLYSLRIVARVG